jgi:hypothetical protein
MARGLTSALALVVLLTAGSASAQQRGQPAQQGGSARSSSQFTLRREEAGGSDGTTARSRARAGDCAGAMPSFDAAIRNTIEPTLRRDRGLCHEKLGNVYPAIDDYRYYLTARPEANDADQIRERLARLEEATGQGGPSAQQVKESGGGAEASVSVSTSGGGSTGAKRAQADKNYDEYLAQEKLADAAETSALRYGTGWVIGPYLTIPKKYFAFGSQGFIPDLVGYGVGATIRYSFGSTFSFISEIGYGGLGTSGEATAAGGVQAMVGGELRIPFSRFASDQIFVGFGVAFERYVVKDLDVGFDFFPARARVGYRHVFGPSIALDIGADLGLIMFARADGGDTAGGNGGSIGGAAAFLVAF